MKAGFMQTVTDLEKIGAAIRDELAAKAGDKSVDDVSEDQLEAWTKEMVFSVFNGDAVSSWAEHGTFGSVNARRIREQTEKVLDGEPVEELDDINPIEMLSALIRHLPIVMYYGYRHHELSAAENKKLDDRSLMKILTGVYSGTPTSEVSDNLLNELEDPSLSAMVDGIFAYLQEYFDESAIAILLQVVKGRTTINVEEFGEERGKATSRDFLTGLAIGLAAGKEFHNVRR